MVRFSEQHSTLFVVCLGLAMVTATIAPVLNVGAVFHRPWKPGYVEKYDLRPEADMLLALNVAHWSAVVAGCLAVLLMLGAATALPLAAAIPLSLLAFLLGVWNSVGLSSRMW